MRIFSYVVFITSLSVVSPNSSPSVRGLKAQEELFSDVAVPWDEGDLDPETGNEPKSGCRSAKEISALTSSVKTVFSSEDISKVLPQRYPFLLVDRVIEYDTGKRAVGIKSVTLNEPHFTGHFPDHPIMPGVLQVEALAQLAGIVCLQIGGAEPGAIFFFAGADGVEWKKPVVPGDNLVMEVEITKWNKIFGIAKATGRAYVDGEDVVTVKEMTFAVAE